MKLFAAFTYWFIVVAWLAVLTTVCLAHWRNTRTFASAKLLLAVLAIDTTRNIIENVYFGLYFGSQYGLFPGVIAGVLGIPEILILPKLINVAAACLVLGVLLLRWLPLASQERTDALKGRADAERRFELLVDGVKEYAIYLLDTRGRITSWNKGAERIKGYASTEVIGQHFAKFYTESERAADGPQEALRTAARQGRFEATAQRIRKDGGSFWAHVIIEPVWHEDRLVGFAKITKDVSQEKSNEEALWRLAHIDQLTELPNRVALLAELAKRSLDSHGAGWAALMLVGLDDFKTVNDSLGHAIGDRLLVEVARRLQNSDGRTQNVYRLGGDEFVVLVDCRDVAGVTGVARTTLKTLDEPYEIDGRRIHIGATAGLVLPHAAIATVDELISDADLARTTAKRSAQRYRLFAPAMRAEAQARQALETELRRAFAQNEFVLHFQPQVLLEDGAVVGAEALLRWQHPERGLISPGEFIDALARSAIGPAVGSWILLESCRAAAAWRGAGRHPLRVSVNMFPDQFADPDLVERVQAVLSETGLPANALELEITENIALGRDDDTLAKLHALRRLGVCIALDDFGTGFASLSYLMRFPLTRLKIDRSFIAKITGTAAPIDTAIVRSVITMADNLGLEVIAEGVETLEQVAFLRARRCEQAQGYFYSEPLPASHFADYLSLTDKRSLIIA